MTVNELISALRFCNQDAEVVFEAYDEVREMYYRPIDDREVLGCVVVLRETDPSCLNVESWNNQIEGLTHIEVTE